MKLITSFTTDHTKIKPGIYISRKDGDITTYDLRMKTPNAGVYMSHLQLHSLEHLLATFMRNGNIGDKIIYVGPMGCRTGFYLLTRDVPDETVLSELITALEAISVYKGKMPGKDIRECGNYKQLSVKAARDTALEYLTVLKNGKNDFKYY